MENEWRPVVRRCRNCGQKITGFQNAKGLVKVTCPKCGSCSVSRMISRRHERCDTYAPQGTILLDDQ